MNYPRTVPELTESLLGGGYLADRGLATTLLVSLTLRRPVLIEGEVGVGKTEIAKTLAAVFGRRLIRLQCYEGINTSQALYEWDYARQMLQIRALSQADAADERSVDRLFGPKFLLERPLLEAIKKGDQAVLLIDEIDRADDEFEAFLLEVLSDFQISIPELGTVKAESSPVVILTSNRTRELHDALRRRCLYHWIGYPTEEREAEIVAIREPRAAERLTRKVVRAVHRLRELDLAKPPGVAETIDWVRTLDVLGEPELTRETASDTLGAVVKDRDDLDLVRENLAEIISGALTMREQDPFSRVLIGFAHELRSAGMKVGTDDVLTYFKAMTPLDPTDLVDLYWAGKVTLLSRREDIPTYDRVFRRYFLGEEAPARNQLTLRPQSVKEAALVMPGTEPGPAGGDEERPVLGWMASNVDALKHRSFTACTPEELAALRRIMQRMRLTPPRRRTRRTRTRPAARGTAPDLRATLRASMRMHGEPPGQLFFRQRKTKLRPLILILDVSGSMTDYSRHLLQFAHTARHAAAKVEVFVFGTRLTRITRELTPQRVDAALDEAARSVLDWDGGTRIGQSLDAFIRRWGRNGLCRGGVVVICSDGLDRGDPEVLAAAMERLGRLCHRIVWLNPHKGDDRDFRPSTLGMMVAAPHVDLLLSGHDLASLEELAKLLPVLN